MHIRSTSPQQRNMELQPLSEGWGVGAWLSELPSQTMTWPSTLHLIPISFPRVSFRVSFSTSFPSLQCWKRRRTKVPKLVFLLVLAALLP